MTYNHDTRLDHSQLYVFKLDHSYHRLEIYYGNMKVLIMQENILYNLMYRLYVLFHTLTSHATRVLLILYLFLVPFLP
jgi:hypothetical protein